MVSQIEMIEMVGVGWISLENKKAAKEKPMTFFPPHTLLNALYTHEN